MGIELSVKRVGEYSFEAYKVVGLGALRARELPKEYLESSPHVTYIPKTFQTGERLVIHSYRDVSFIVSTGEIISRAFLELVLYNLDTCGERLGEINRANRKKKVDKVITFTF